jgi:hypothetical protein
MNFKKMYSIIAHPVYNAHPVFYSIMYCKIAHPVYNAHPVFYSIMYCKIAHPAYNAQSVYGTTPHTPHKEIVSNVEQEYWLANN